MKILISLLLTIAIGFCGEKDTLLESRFIDLNGEFNATQVLLKAGSFGFGVGEGVTLERATDVAFEEVLAGPNAVKDFTTIFEKGNVYSKLYALTALKQLDNALFQKLAKTMKKEQIVGIQDGCCISELTVEKVIAGLKKGHYSGTVKIFIVKRIRALEKKIAAIDAKITQVTFGDPTSKEAKEYGERLLKIRNAVPLAKTLKTLPEDSAKLKAVLSALQDKWTRYAAFLKQTMDSPKTKTK